ncbi:alpha/beta hydrolase [archaeon]|jgi:alpha-beta hydrolase superfamily lysophospholipase|nr:alpha/beta hydrolase [archaeon]MBT6698075.1 alpha/beta hydrolase [archaeon]
MEKVTFTNSNGLKLSGVYYAGSNERKSKGIILCHGFASKKDGEKYVFIAKKCNELGFSVLRFDFGGCGESEKRPILVSDQVVDLQSAIFFMKSKGCKEFGFLGNSLGGQTVLKASNKEISRTIVLWAPAIAARKKQWIKQRLSKWQKEKEDYVFTYNEKKYFISKNFIQEQLDVNQKILCSPIDFPVLTIHGDTDKVVNISDSKKAMEYFNSDSKLEIILGAGHRFSGENMYKAIDLTVSWFDKWM